jgi:hypothetical protein
VIRLRQWWDEIRTVGSGILIVVLFAVGSVWPFLVFGTDARGTRRRGRVMVVVVDSSSCRQSPAFGWSSE